MSVLSTPVVPGGDVALDARGATTDTTSAPGTSKGTDSSGCGISTRGTNHEALGAGVALVEQRAGNNRFLSRKDRKGHDNYETPAWAVASLLARHPEIDGSILDPCCGPGSIVREVRRLRPTACVGGYELRDIAVPDGCRAGVDGLAELRVDALDGGSAAWAVLNPPFTMALDFALTAWSAVDHGMAIFQRTAWMEGLRRGRDLWDVLPLAQVWIFRHRVDCFPEGQVDHSTSGMLCFAWYVFRHGYTGRPALGWIDDRADLTHDTRLGGAR